MNDKIDYVQLAHNAKFNMVKEALTLIFKNVDYTKTHIILSFLTNYSGVVLPDHIKKDFPLNITIVLQHQFRHLKVHGNHFSVVLSFKGKEETIVVPFRAITKYVDVVAAFALDLHSEDGAVPYKDEDYVAPVDPSEAQEKTEQKDEEVTPENNVISINKFRKS